MKKVFILLLLLSINLVAQGKISFDFDYAQFNYDSTNTHLELYYSIGQGDLKSLTKEDGNYIGAYLDIIITDTLSKSILINKRYLSQTKITSQNDSIFRSKNLVGNVSFVLGVGTYSLSISGTDIADSNNSKHYNEIIKIKKFPQDKYSLSDIQLATRIVSDSKNKESIFYKNTMEVFPNPHDIYTENMPVLFYYSELYNLNHEKYKGRNLLLVEQLSDSYGKVLKIKRISLQTKNSSIVQAGIINLKKYPTGAYTLSLSIIEDSTNVGISSAKLFYLINPSVESNKVVLSKNFDVKSSEFGILSEEECDELFAVSEPIATEEDSENYEKLQNIESKRKFLFDFWKMRDQIPETTRNEFKEEYLERVRFVEQRYKTFVKRGVKTERGRVYLQYGEPDEVDSYPSEYNMKPYEVWKYNAIEGGVLFVFGDVTGYNNYELMHSTKRGEMRDDYWQRRITVE